MSNGDLNWIANYIWGTAPSRSWTGCQGKMNPCGNEWIRAAV